MITDPATAQHYLDNIRVGRCRHCGSGYTVNRNGQVRKHGCPQDYPDATALWDHPEGAVVWIRLDDLALIAKEAHQ